jgi:Uma2 family endonuclease
MSAVPRQPGPSYTGLRMTADEYLALGETDERYELIDGVVTMSPRPGSRHHDAMWLVVEQARTFAKASGGRCFSELDLVLHGGLVYTPDIMCFGPNRVRGFPMRVDTAPDLIVEVLSPSNKRFDLTRKRDDYERFGVGEYWTLEPTTAHVQCFRRAGSRLAEQNVAGDTLTSLSWAGFVLDLRPLRELAAEE